MKKVIYTAIVGNYDYINQPLVVNKDFDYILFSNDIDEDYVGVWEIRRLPPPCKNKDKVKVARWIKTHPHLLLSEYVYSVWIDSNVLIASDDVYRRTDDLYRKGILISSMSHPERDCIYDECLEVAVKKRDSLHRIIPEFLFLKHQKYPAKAGLCETNFVFRNHKNLLVQKVCEDWWSMIDRFSRRDQLSFNYVNFTNQVQVDYFLGPKYCTHNHPFFEWHSHKESPYKSKIWVNYFEKHACRIYKPTFTALLHCEDESLKESILKYYLYTMDYFLNQILVLRCNRYVHGVFAKFKKLLCIKKKT